MSLSTQVCWKQPWGNDAEAVLRRALAAQAHALEELPAQQWDRRQMRLAGFRDVELSYVAPAGDRWSSILLHLDAHFGEELGRELSRLERAPVMVFRESGQECWGYVLMHEGEERDRFWNKPELVDEDPKSCTGDARRLADTLGVAAVSLTPYLAPTTDANHGVKIHADDEFTLGDPWVRTDFMHHLGITYPEPGYGTGRYVLVSEPRLGGHAKIRASASGAPGDHPWREDRPWWRFW